MMKKLFTLIMTLVALLLSGCGGFKDIDSEIFSLKSQAEFNVNKVQIDTFIKPENNERPTRDKLLKRISEAIEKNKDIKKELEDKSLDDKKLKHLQTTAILSVNGTIRFLEDAKDAIENNRGEIEKLDRFITTENLSKPNLWYNKYDYAYEMARYSRDYHIDESKMVLAYRGKAYNGTGFLHNIGGFASIVDYRGALEGDKYAVSMAILITNLSQKDMDIGGLTIAIKDPRIGTTYKMDYENISNLSWNMVGQYGNNNDPINTLSPNSYVVKIANFNLPRSYAAVALENLLVEYGTLGSSDVTSEWIHHQVADPSYFDINNLEDPIKDFESIRYNQYNPDKKFLNNNINYPLLKDHGIRKIYLDLTSVQHAELQNNRHYIGYRFILDNGGEYAQEHHTSILETGKGLRLFDYNGSSLVPSNDYDEYAAADLINNNQNLFFVNNFNK